MSSHSQIPQHNCYIGNSKSQFEIKSRSSRDAIKEYIYIIKIMQWDKTNYNKDGKICARGKSDI